MAGPTEFKMEDTLAGGLGVAIGLLKAGKDGAFTLNSEWFSDPLGHLRKIADPPSKLFDLLEAISGKPHELLKMKWHPVPSAEGLFVVRQGTGERDYLGLGFKRDIAVRPGGEAALSSYVYLPLFDLKSRQFLKDAAAAPMRLGAAVQGSFARGDFAFKGFSADLKVYFANRAPEIDLRVSGLELPDGIALPRAREAEDKDTGESSLIDLAQSASGNLDQWLDVALGLLSSDLSGLFSDEATRRRVRSAFSSLRIFVQRPFPNLGRDSPEKLLKRLRALSALFQGEPPDGERAASFVRGKGTASEPFQAELYRSPAGFGVMLSLFTEISGGASRLRAGFGLETKAFPLLPSLGFGLKLDAAFTDPPRFALRLAAQHPAAASQRLLFGFRQPDDPDSYVGLDAIEIGLSWSSGAPEPFVAFAGLATGRNPPQKYGLAEIRADGGARLLQLARAALAAYSAYQTSIHDTPPHQIWYDWEIPPREDEVERELAQARALAVLDRLLGYAKALLGLGPDDPLDKMVPRIEQLVAALPGLEPAELPSRILAQIVKAFESKPGGDSLIQLSPGRGLGVAIGIKENPAGREWGVWVTPKVDLPFFRFEACVGLAFLNRDPSNPALSLRTVAALNAGVGLKSELAGSFGYRQGRGEFSLEFNPAGRFQVSLLPSFAFRYRGSDASVAVSDWTTAFAQEVGVQLMGDLVLGSPAAQRGLDASLLGKLDARSTFTLGALLVEVGLLERDRFGEVRRYRIATVRDWSALRPDRLMSAACRRILGEVDSLRLLSSGGDDGIALIREEGNYGVRIRMSDIALTKPNLRLQLGQWLPGETDKDNWLTRSGSAAEPAGMKILLLRQENGRWTFKPSVTLTSIGLDYGADGANPLLDVKGYRLGGFRPRLRLRIDGSEFKVAGALRLDGLSIPLVPGGGGGDNPVAKDLLGSGSASSAPGPSAPPEPAFSLVVAGSERATAAIVTDSPSGEKMVWLRVDRAFGPLYCRMLGLGFESEGSPRERYPRLLLGYDGRVALGPLTIELLELAVGIPIRRPADLSAYSVSLRGLDLSVDGGPVEISGGLFQTGTGALIEYSGAIFVRTETFTISGLGSYAMVGSAPSFFAYAVLYKDLGGPAWFHVRGLALGFAYNRRLILPAIEDVKEFPLVRAAREPGFLSADNPKEALAKVSACVPISPGDYWLAAGVLFTSFEMVRSFALLTVAFGRDIEIGVLGYSQASVPPNSSNPIAYAEIALSARFKPADGLLAVRGQLTPASYILSRDCKLTGAFAFYSWFRGPHEGDFVLSLGGYHPKFQKPDHYPDVPQRLGINWQIGSNLSIKGQQYFALTPSALMAGALIQATFEAGDLRAWFSLEAHFLVQWKPFYYDAFARVEIGVSYRLWLLFTTETVSVHLGVDVRLWGPPFGGEAYIDWSIISFTISFGAGRTDAPLRIPWTQADGSGFKESFLPREGGVCAAAVTSGLVADLKQRDPKAPFDWVVSGEDFALETRSLIPSKKANFNGAERTGDWEDEFGVNPVGVSVAGFKSQHEITLKKRDESRPAEDAAAFSPAAGIGTKEVTRAVPKSLWGVGVSPSSELSSADKTIPETLGGFRLVPDRPPPQRTADIPEQVLLFSSGKDQRCHWRMGPAEPRRFDPADPAAVRDSLVKAGLVDRSESWAAADPRALLEEPATFRLGDT